MGFLCGVGGVVLASYVGYGTIAAGTGYELDAIAACILGGTSPLGGIGTIPGAVLGAVVMQSLRSGMQLLNLSSPIQDIVVGVVLVAAIGFDTFVQRRSSK